MITVNGRQLDRDEYIRTCRTYMMQTGKEEISSEEKTAIANQLVNAHLLLQDGKNSDIKVSAEETEENFKKIKAQYPSEKDFADALDKIGDTEDSIRHKLNENIILQKYLSEYFYMKASVSQDEIESFYNDNKDQFVSQMQVKASHILVKGEKEANDIKTELESGADFEDLAKNYSKCPSAKNSGDLGFFSKGQMVPEFEKEAFALETGCISSPVLTQFGYHIIKVTEKKESAKQDFETVKNNIDSYLRKNLADRMISEKISELREKSEIYIDEENL